MARWKTRSKSQYGPEILDEFNRASLINGVDNSFERDGAETDAIVRPIALRRLGAK